jgi:hypothetical protein
MAKKALKQQVIIDTQKKSKTGNQKLKNVQGNI